VVLVDEGDLMLRRDLLHRLNVQWPKKLVLLSAIPRSTWSPTQELSFSTIKNKTALYIDASCVFPAAKLAANLKEPEPLPSKPDLLVEFAVARSKEVAILFWGKSSTYS